MRVYLDRLAAPCAKVPTMLIHRSWSVFTVILLGLVAGCVRLDETQALVKAERYDDALPRVTLLAKYGDAKAQNLLGWLYENGYGAPRDPAEAARWYRKAADQGLPLAQNNLGILYREGRGVAKDLAEAARWFDRAATAGHIEAINNLGVMYDHGQGVPENNAEAVRLFEKAANENLGRAKTNLGLMYQRGEGVPQNIAIARKYFEEASANGDLQGRMQLGVLMLAGSGGRKDPEAAKTLLESAALGGEPRAAYQLALAAAEKVESYAWLNLAASAGDQPSIELRNRLRGELSEELLAAAEARSTELAKRKKS